MSSPRFKNSPYTRPADVKPLYSASCYCKQIKFEISQVPLNAMYCHCETCQTLHGTPFQWASVIPKDSVVFAPDSLPHLTFFSASAGHDVTDTDEVPVKIGCDRCHAQVADEGRNMMLILPPFIDFPRSSSTTGRKIVPKEFQATHHMFYGKRVMDIHDNLEKYVTKKGGDKCDDEGNPIQ